MIRAYYRLAKPGIVYGNILPALAAFLFASHAGIGGYIDLQLFVATIVGLSLSIAGACVVNNIIDRDIDVHMERTKKRSLVTGKISVYSAAWYARILLLAGFLLLFFFTNVYALCATLLGVVVYIGLYTPAKRFTVHSTIIGSVAGAVPPVVGYAAVANTIDSTAILLFLILVCWQMTHFFAIAIFRKDEYEHAQLPIMSVRLGILPAKALLFAYSLLFTASVLILGYVQNLSLAYFILMSAMSAVWVALSAYGFWCSNEKKWARTLFRYSLIVIMLFSVILALS